MPLSLFTVGFVTPTREEAIEMLKEIIYDEQIENRKNRNSNSIEIYRNPTCKIIWIKEYSYRYLGHRFNVVFCKNPIQHTAWFHNEVEPCILDYDMISGLKRWRELRNIEIMSAANNYIKNGNGYMSMIQSLNPQKNKIRLVRI